MTRHIAPRESRASSIVDSSGKIVIRPEIGPIDRCADFYINNTSQHCTRCRMSESLAAATVVQYVELKLYFSKFQNFIVISIYASTTLKAISPFRANNENK